jgi:hypothetical protein
MTSSNWTKKARASSKAGANADETGGAAAESDPAAVLRRWLLSSRGKGLLELIEAMGGKRVSLKVGGAGLLSNLLCVANMTRPCISRNSALGSCPALDIP